MHTPKRFLFVLALLLALGCGETPVETAPPPGGDGPDEPPAPVVGTIYVQAPQRQLPDAPVSIQLTASALDPDEAAIPDHLLTFTWSSTDTTVLAVDTTGRVSVRGAGSARIDAAAGGEQGGLTLQVLPLTGTGVPSMDLALVGFMEEWQVPGAAYAVVRNDQLVIARGYGFADLATETPVRPNHLFRIASLSKSITGTALMKLAEAGQIDLQAKVFDLLPQYVPAGGPADARLLDVTVDQMLRHTSGWDLFGPTDPMFLPRTVASAMGTQSPPEPATLIDYLMTQPLGFAPGTQHRYTNINYLVLGRVIEAVTGQPYETYVQEQVFAPVGITRPQVGRTFQADQPADEVTYYSEDWGMTASVFDAQPGPVEMSYGGFYLESMDAHGGWIASAVDLARYGAALNGHPGVAEILSASSRGAINTYPGTPFGNGSWYSAGWFVNRSGASTLWTHTGALTGMVSLLTIRADGTVLVALVNTRRVAGGVSSQYFNDFVGRFTQAVDALAPNDWPTTDLFPEYF